jgi:hypothetical protein
MTPVWRGLMGMARIGVTSIMTVGIGAACMGLARVGSAAAQNAAIQAEPLPPLQQQQQQQDASPLLQTPLSPGVPGQSPAPPATPPAAIERPNVWLPAGAVKLQALDKVNAQATTLTIKVGQSGTFGSLTIAVKACLVRPADQPPDATAYLDVTDSHPDSPGFDGWMLQAEPGLSMMQHPIYDLRVAGCA